MPYTVFVEHVDAANVAEVASRGEDIQGVFTSPINDPADDGKLIESFKTERPSFAEDDLLERLTANGVVVNAKPIDDPTPFWQRLLLGIIPTLLLVGVVVLVFRAIKKRGGGPPGLGGFGRSKARRYEQTGTRTCFDDIAGIDEAEEQLDQLAEALLEHETLDGDGIYEIVGLGTSEL